METPKTTASARTVWEEKSAALLQSGREYYSRRGMNGDGEREGERSNEQGKQGKRKTVRKKQIKS